MNERIKRMIGFEMFAIFLIMGILIKINYYSLWEFINALPFGESSANGFFLVVLMVGCFAICFGGLLILFMPKDFNQEKNPCVKSKKDNQIKILMEKDNN